MRFQILHESEGRVRLRADQIRMSMEQADVLEAWIMKLPGVTHVTVHERICGIIIIFHGSRDELYHRLSSFSYDQASDQVQVLSHNSRALNREYKATPHK